MRVADYVANYLAAVNPNVFGVCGGGALFLNDAICHHPGINFTATHHEQAAGFAAEADARVTGRPGIVSVTVGPGGSNLLTAVSCAYVDSIPMIIVAGQVSSTTIKSKNERQRGVNELPIAEILRPVTKYSTTVTKADSISHIMNAAYVNAMAGRKGPVFVEIPLDIQGQQCSDEPVCLPEIEPPRTKASDREIQQAVDMIGKAERPVLIIGTGIHLSGAKDVLLDFLDTTGMPMMTSWSAIDVIPEDASVIGRPGLFGDRAGNLAMQNADLVLAVGTRLSVPQIGHSTHAFAPRAKKIVVDIDWAELDNKMFKVDLAIRADAKAFFDAIVDELPILVEQNATWHARCSRWKTIYPVMQPEYRAQETGVNSYFAIEQIAKNLESTAIIVTDVGAPFLTAMPSMQLKTGQRLIHSCGVSPMGWGLPAAIGACVATNRERQVICLTGDGGLMFNLQELQTVVHHQLPIAIFVFCNNGYMTMQTAQVNHFGRESISSPESGLSCPDFMEVAKAFGLQSWSFSDNAEFLPWAQYVSTRRIPFLAQLHMMPRQMLAPRVQSKMENGRFLPADMADLWPYLPRDEFAEQMGKVSA